MWSEAIRSNLAADQANRDYFASTSATAKASPASIPAYHALDFLVNSYLQLAQDRRARAIVEERNSSGASPSGGSITAYTGFAAIPVRYALERHAWAEAAELPPMQTPFKQAEAIIYFGRALGAARLGNAAAARQELSRIARLRQELASVGDPYWAEQVGIQEAAASAWIALAEKDAAGAVTSMTAAADREDRSEKHVAMENRLSPMRELLGELLLEAGRPAEALRQFERSLEVVPERFRSLAGAARAAAESGNRRAAIAHNRRLLVLAAEADGDRPALAAARKYLAAADALSHPRRPLLLGDDRLFHDAIAPASSVERVRVALRALKSLDVAGMVWHPCRTRDSECGRKIPVDSRSPAIFGEVCCPCRVRPSC